MKKLLFVAEDPGSANALAPVLLRLSSKYDTTVWAHKYALSIFQNKNISCMPQNVTGNFGCLQRYDMVVSGASGSSPLERNSVREARTLGIPTLSVLDAWGNYWQRYSSTSKKDFLYLPQKICVMDSICKKAMLQEGFPLNSLVVTGNPFFDTFSPLPPAPARTLLFVGQPKRKNNQWFSDFKVLKQILEATKGRKVVLRPHPKEDVAAYQHVAAAYSHVHVDATSIIASLLSSHELVLGRFSMVLFEAVCRGRTVVSYEDEGRLISNTLGCSHYATSIHHLLKLLQASKRLPRLSQAPLKEYVSGMATTRVCDQINQLFT